MLEGLPAAVDETPRPDCAHGLAASCNELLRVQGYAILRGFLPDSHIDDLTRTLHSSRGKAGTRKLLEAPWCRNLAQLIRDDPRVRSCLSADARAVQCTLFIKSMITNWLVPLHQDLSIPLAGRVDSPLYCGWSRKEGELFARAPVALLQQLLAVRLHLDDCDGRNGALRVVPGSHQGGRLSYAELLRERNVRGERLVAIDRGGALLMKPLLLHASSKVTIDLPRRVLHFVFGPGHLPGGAQWPTRVL